jgi:hypothetical protein
MESEDKEEMRKGLLSNPFDMERVVAEAMEDGHDPYFKPGDEEEGEVSTAEFVKNIRVGRAFSGGERFLR